MAFLICIRSPWHQLGPLHLRDDRQVPSRDGVLWRIRRHRLRATFESHVAQDIFGLKPVLLGSDGVFIFSFRSDFGALLVLHLVQHGVARNTAWHFPGILLRILRLYGGFPLRI